MGLDDVVSNKQAQTDTLIFGSEEGVEDAPPRLFTHAHTGVREGGHNVLPFFSCRDTDGAFLNDGFHRIADEIHESQFDEILVEQGNLIVGTVEADLYSFRADRNAHEIEGLLDHSGEHGFPQYY